MLRQRGQLFGEFFGVLLSYPGTSGAVRDFADLTAAVHERGAQVVVAADLLGLCSSPSTLPIDLIAAVAAEGKSNRDIAQELFLSVKTVETHLSAVYRKLDISGRAELAASLG